MVKYTHAVVHAVISESGSQVDELIYATDINHAYALAHQLMAVGKTNLAILQLKEPTTIEDTPNE